MDRYGDSILVNAALALAAAAIEAGPPTLHDATYEAAAARAGLALTVVDIECVLEITKLPGCLHIVA